MQFPLAELHAYGVALLFFRHDWSRLQNFPEGVATLPASHLQYTTTGDSALGGMSHAGTSTSGIFASAASNVKLVGYTLRHPGGHLRASALRVSVVVCSFASVFLCPLGYTASACRRTVAVEVEHEHYCE